MHFIAFNFKWQLNHINIFNATVDFATVKAKFEICGWAFDSANLMSCSIILWFRAFVWCKLERKNHSCRDILWQRKQYLEGQFRPLWIWFMQSSSEPRKWHFMKNIICWWMIPKVKKLVLCFIKNIGYSQRGRDRFRMNASSSSFCSGKYHWNSISRDWKWSIT